MPFQSEAQRRFLWAKHPDVAEKWTKENPKQTDLPEHKKGRYARMTKDGTSKS